MNRIADPLRSQMGIEDTSARRLMRVLADEAAKGGQLGALYADHLDHALATWLLSRGTRERLTRAAASVLSPHILRRSWSA